MELDEFIGVFVMQCTRISSKYRWIGEDSTESSAHNKSMASKASSMEPSRSLYRSKHSWRFGTLYSLCNSYLENKVFRVNADGSWAKVYLL